VSFVNEFLREIRLQSDRTRGNHLMITMGSDFQVKHINETLGRQDLFFF